MLLRSASQPVFAVGNNRDLGDGVGAVAGGYNIS
jgi:hypothetical protein